MSGQGQRECDSTCHTAGHVQPLERMHGIGERRRWQRQPEQKLVAYTWLDGQDLTCGMGMAKTLDLGEGGVGIRIHRALGAGATFHMFMAVQEPLVEVRARVVHEREMHDGFYRMGACFLCIEQKGRRYTGGHG